MNVAPFAVPGLFPTTNPVSDSRVFTNPDGSIMYKLSEIPQGEDIPEYKFVLATTAYRIILLDKEGSHLFTSVDGEGVTHCYFVITSDEEAIPVGTNELTIMEDSSKRVVKLTNIDNPFNLGAGSKYKLLEKCFPLTYVVRGDVTLTASQTTAVVYYPRPFSSVPEHLMVAVKDSSGNITNVAATITAANETFFTVTFSANPVLSGYKLEWAIWTEASPMVLANLEPDYGPYYI